MSLKDSKSRTVPGIGRIIHATVRVHDMLVVRPAMIVRVWPGAKPGEVASAVQAQVFMDGDGSSVNDGTPNCLWKSSLQFDPTGKLEDSWRWPARE